MLWELRFVAKIVTEAKRSIAAEPGVAHWLRRQLDGLGEKGGCVMATPGMTFSEECLDTMVRTWITLYDSKLASIDRKLDRLLAACQPSERPSTTVRHLRVVTPKPKRPAPGGAA